MTRPSPHRTITLRDPLSDKAAGSIAVQTASDARALSSTLRTAQKVWQSRSFEDRAAILGKWGSAISTHRDALLKALCADTGRMAESILEVEAVVSILERWSNTDPAAFIAQSRDSATPHVRIEQELVPYPLVGVIAPWNGPLLLSLIDAIPALLAGCAVMIKPSEITPRFCEPLRTTLADVPELQSVVGFISGDGETGEALIDCVDAICFTGSTATGLRVAQHAAARLIPAFLELGGKDPAVVLPDANLELAASAILWGSITNAGQACQSLERVYVHQDQIEAFTTLLVAMAKNVALSFDAPETGIGPIISRDQIAIIQGHLDDAIKKGAKAETGGRITHDGGTWFSPTVLTGVNHEMLVMQEETFGPVIPLMAYDDVEQAIMLANDTQFGLSAAVFGANEENALAVARRLDAGAVSINDAAMTAIVGDAEKVAFKASGLGGSRMGAASIRRFYRPRAFLVNKTARSEGRPRSLLARNSKEQNNAK